MAGQSRKWMILVATIWIQSFTGTNFDFSAYSSEMKAVLGVSQAQLNYLATASDLGKVFGWSSGLALLWLPLWAVLFTAAGMGLVGYGAQWLVLRHVISLPYFLVFLFCLLSGCSICWFNTVCFVLCIRNFPANWPLALSLTVSFNGISAALYNLAATSLNTSSSAVYVLLNALVPLFTSIVVLIPILRQPPATDHRSPLTVKRNQLTFLKLNLLAVVTGLYLLFIHPSNPMAASLIFAGAIFLLVLPLGVPGIICAREWFEQAIDSSLRLDGSEFILVNADDLELHKELLSRDASEVNRPGLCTDIGLSRDDDSHRCSCASVIDKDQLGMLGQEHKAEMLVRRLDFWLYYIAYFCGGTIGLAYSNNLGQIAPSLGHGSMNSKLITIYSSFSFFGRLLSAAPDFIRMKLYFARTGWLAIALIPMPVAFFLLSVLGNEALAIQAGTALVGLSSGFIFAAAVSVTSELFGSESLGVNHNILITNIPLGSLLYGFLAAVVYDSNSVAMSTAGGDMMVCMGMGCYLWTFVWWGCVSLFGVASSFLLFLRTRPAYRRFELSRLLMASSEN